MNIINLAVGAVFLGGVVGGPLGGYMLFGKIDYKSADSHLALACKFGAMNYLEHNEATQLLSHDCTCFGDETVKRLDPVQRVSVATTLRSFMIEAKKKEYQEVPYETIMSLPERDAVMQSPLGDPELLSWVSSACLRQS